jgi:GT2 family glycosyltransferase
MMLGNSSSPELAVVVPTRGMPHAVVALLDSLDVAVGRLPGSTEVEMLVVDDSPPSDAHTIAERCARSGVRYLRGPRRVGAKRNVGTRASTAPIVLYIDSDCLASPDLLVRHLSAHRRASAPSGRPVAAVAGPTLVPDATESPAWRVVMSSVVVNSPWSWPARFAEVWWAATANLSVRRDAFAEIDGFDERTFTVVGGEDVDFGVRLHAAGWTTVCDPQAWVAHRTDGVTSVQQFRRKMFRYGRAGTYNCMRQPEYARWSANPVFLTFAGVVAGLAGAASGRPNARRSGGALVGGALVAAATSFAQRSRAAARAGHLPAREAMAMVSVDWAFHAGIAAEALRRLRPAYAIRRYDYFPAERFYPLDDAEEATA